VVDDAPSAAAHSPTDGGGKWRPSRPLPNAVASTRRLAAILALDVAGYSRLMGADEEGTHERLKAHHRQLVEPRIKEHRGRIVKTTGDGMLAEFASVVDAVRCAAEIQRGMVDREPDLPEGQHIKFRIGINLGDIIAERGDIFGDGVNVAARLQALAELGGICVSGVVRDEIRDKLPFLLDDLGEQNVKNIARPVQVYALRPAVIADLPASSTPIVAPRRRRAANIAVASGVAAALVLSVSAWWLWPIAKTSRTAETAATTSISQPLVPPRLSIVVLPFANLSNESDQQYFADGVTDDLTTDLSRIADMFVISASTALTYRNKPIDAKQLGRELGVRYVLEGSIQRSGNQVRINAQLIDTETDTHLWAERFDRSVSDLFALQSEITGRIANTLKLKVIAAEANRRVEHPDALDYIFRGRDVFFERPPSRENFSQAIALYENALALAPQSAEAKTWLAGALVNRVIQLFTESPAADLARSEKLIDEALAAAPDIPWAHYVKGTVLRWKGQWEDAISEFETARSLDRNMTGPLQGLGWCKLFTGSLDEVIPLAEEAIRLSPRDPTIGHRYYMIGEVCQLWSRPQDAIAWFEKARGAISAFPGLWAHLAAAYALAGDTERAAAELAEARRLNGDVYSSIAHVKATQPWGVPKVQALVEATYFAGLRKAGVPKE